jgi:hypothetical protein
LWAQVAVRVQTVRILDSLRQRLHCGHLVVVLVVEILVLVLVQVNPEAPVAVEQRVVVWVAQEHQVKEILAVILHLRLLLLVRVEVVVLVLLVR